MKRFARICGVLVVGAVAGGAGVSMWPLVHAQQTPARGPVNKAQIEQWKKELSNWGRWGANDEKGAVNLITAAKSGV